MNIHILLLSIKEEVKKLINQYDVSYKVSLIYYIIVVSYWALFGLNMGKFYSIWHGKWYQLYIWTICAVLHCAGHVLEKHIQCCATFPLSMMCYMNAILQRRNTLIYLPLSDSPWSSVPNSSRRSVRASRNSIIPWAGIAIWERGPPRGLVCAT